MRLKKTRHDVAIQAYVGLEYGCINWHGIKVFDKALGDKWATASVQYRYKKWNADLLFAHSDLWTIREDVPKIANKTNFMAYPPVDHDPMPPPLVQALRDVDWLVAMTRYTQRKMREEGMRSVYIPHGVDLDIYKPLPQDRVRDKFNIDTDKFVFGCVVVNKGFRKNLHNILRAYKRFLERGDNRKQNAELYLHTYVKKDKYNPEGLQLPVLVRQLDIPDQCIRFTKPSRYIFGLSEEEMNQLYNTFDVLLQSTRAEGFGLPVIEAFATGIPVIGSDFSSMPELIEDKRGWLVDVADLVPQQRTCSWHGFPSTDDIVRKMEIAYENRDELKRKGENAKKWVQKLGWDRLFEEKWMKLFDQVEDQIKQRGSML